METKDLFYLLGAIFCLAGILALNISVFIMKRAGLWNSVKAFGVDVPNWSFHESLHSFWKNRNLIDSKVQHRLYFQWKLGFMFLVLGLMSFLLSALGQ